MSVWDVTLGNHRTTVSMPQHGLQGLYNEILDGWSLPVKYLSDHCQDIATGVVGGGRVITPGSRALAQLNITISSSAVERRQHPWFIYYGRRDQATLGVGMDRNRVETVSSVIEVLL
ncbi:hypothetical protein FRC03_006987 [Tulasnella sp. 419]|nr:hypothetical protein FRC03_006987 [Tulasnella sp. 419]